MAATQRNGSRRLPFSPDERRQEQGTLDSLDRPPPQNLEAERGVLGSVLYEPFLMDELAGKINADDFYSDANRQVFIAINNIHAAGRRVDVTLLHDRLTRAKMLEFVGGVAYLMEIAESVPHAHNCLYYAEFVREAAVRRRMIAASVETLRSLYDPISDVRAIAAAAETKIADIAAGRDSDALAHFSDVSASVIQKFKAQKNKPQDQQHRGVRSNLMALDAIMGPYECGQVTLIAARTSVGKTAFATSQVADWMENTDQVGYFCTLEMSRYELCERIQCAGASIDLHRFRSGWCGEAEIARMTQWREDCHVAKKLFIDDGAERTVSEILAMARRTRRIAGRLDYVVIDYLQLIEGDGDKYAKRHEVVSKISRTIKIASRALDVPMIVLCQLNREADQGRPRLSHLRESGSLEQDADKVVFIDRQTEGDDAAKATAQLIVAKNRFGKTGECSVAFFGGYQKFQTMHADLAF